MPQPTDPENLPSWFAKRAGLAAYLICGFRAGLSGVLDRPRGYPANPPPSLSWRAGDK